MFDLNHSELSDLFEIVGPNNNHENIRQDIKPTLYDELKTVFLTKDVESIKKILDYLPYFDKTKSIVNHVLKEIEKDWETSVAYYNEIKFNDLEDLVEQKYEKAQ